MCEFCTKHGDGKKWYLQAKNYAEDLASDMDRHRKATARFKYFDEGLRGDYLNLENRFPLLPKPIRRVVASMYTRKNKKEHFGQVLPIEDVERVLSIANSIVRTPCVCRKAVSGREVAYCLGISACPDTPLGKLFLSGPDTAGVDRLSPEQAVEFMRTLEPEGIMHSVWTFETPFIGAICNCDSRECVATRATVHHGVKAMFKGEYIADVDLDLCTGCRNCEKVCQFGAVSISDGKASVDLLRCYGCGSCRAVCGKNAITLLDRVSVPVVANDW